MQFSQALWLVYMIVFHHFIVILQHQNRFYYYL